MLATTTQSLRHCWRTCADRSYILPTCSRRIHLKDFPERHAIPAPTSEVSTPEHFLRAIGRSSETKVEVAEWENFWKLGGLELKERKVGVRDRKYILWCMEKYRQQWKIKDFAHEPKPPKKYRGWGPNVQGGVRLRYRKRE